MVHRETFKNNICYKNTKYSIYILIILILVVLLTIVIVLITKKTDKNGNKYITNFGRGAMGISITLLVVYILFCVGCNSWLQNQVYKITDEIKRNGF